MLGVKSRSSQRKMASSDNTSRKRRLKTSEVLDESPADMLPRKRVKSSRTELKGLSPTFSAKCFYTPNGRGGYQTPLERQRQRELHGVTLPSKPPLESDTNLKNTKKLPTYRSIKVGHTGQGALPSCRTGKTVKKSKTEPAKSKKTADTESNKNKSQSKSFDESVKIDRASPKKNTPKKSPKKRPPSKRTPRKSPRKGVKKAVKLYIQGMKKDSKAASKRTTKGRQKIAEQNLIKKKATQEVGSRAQETEVKPLIHHKRASKKLDLDQEGCAKDGIDTDMSDFAVIAPSPKPTTKKRSMRLKEDTLVSMSCESDKQSPRKSQKTWPITIREGTTKEDEMAKNQYDFLDGFQPQSPDSVATPIAQKVSPRKVAMTTPSFMTLPISPSTSPSISNKLRPTTNSPATSTPIQQRKLNIMRKMADKDGMEQMTLDLGQKRFGATSCETCGMVYTAAHPEDEASHDKFHRKYLNSIKFPGWKKERLLQEFDDGRVIMVLHDDPKYHTKKVEEIRQLVDQELGFLKSGHVACKSSSKVFLFITTDKKVAGCLIAEEISKGYRVIADTGTGQSSSEEQTQFEQQQAWCCETNPEPAVCGISRIWVASQERRKQIATKLLDCLRNFFMFGSVLPKESIAFSDPTPDGKMLATAYMKTARFLVYKYH